MEVMMKFAKWVCISIALIAVLSSAAQGRVIDLRDSTDTDTIRAEVVVKALTTFWVTDTLMCQNMVIIDDMICIKKEITCSIDFSESVFHGNVEFKELTFAKPVLFIDCKFTKSVSFVGAKFINYASFMFSEFSGDADFMSAEFGGDADFSSAEFGGDVNFVLSEFCKGVLFNNSKFYGKTDFMDSKFHDLVFFNDAQFFKPSEFINTKFYDSVEFSYVDFYDTTNFKHANFYNIVYFSYGNFNKAIFRNTVFKENITFWGSNFREFLIFEGASFEKTIDLREVNFMIDDSDNNTKIIFQGMTFGLMKVNWIQLKDKIYLMDSYGLYLPNDYKYFQPIANIYTKLIYNFHNLGQYKDEQACYYDLNQIERFHAKGLDKAWRTVMYLTCGHGVKPERALICSVFVILFMSFVFTKEVTV